MLYSEKLHESLLSSYQFFSALAAEAEAEGKEREWRQADYKACRIHSVICRMLRQMRRDYARRLSNRSSDRLETEARWWAAERLNERLHPTPKGLSLKEAHAFEIRRGMMTGWTGYPGDY